MATSCCFKTSVKSEKVTLNPLTVGFMLVMIPQFCLREMTVHAEIKNNVPSQSTSMKINESDNLSKCCMEYYRKQSYIEKKDNLRDHAVVPSRKYKYRIIGPSDVHKFMVHCFNLLRYVRDNLNLEALLFGFSPIMFLMPQSVSRGMRHT